MKKFTGIFLLCSMLLVWWGLGLGCGRPAPEEKITETVVEEKIADAATPEPTKPEPVAEPTTPEPVAEPTTPEPVAEPTTPEPVAEPITPEPVAEQTTPETVAETVKEPTPPVDGGDEFIPEFEPEQEPENGGVKPDPSAATQIQSVRAGTVGDIQKVAVTYTKETIGNDPAGFFVQATKTGPAVFVAVNPATTTPPLQVGNIISFTVTEVNFGATAVQGRVEIKTITNLQVHGSGFDVKTLAQEVSTATDLISALNNYESELVSFDATLSSDFAAAGSGFIAATIDTDGINGNADLKLRIPDNQSAGGPSIAKQIGLINTCDFTVTAIPMWRFTNTAQPSVFKVSEIKLNSCPPSQVASARATNATTIIVTFSRPIDAKSVKTDGSQFTFDNNLTASAAAVSANGYEITVTTSQQDGSATYLVTVDTSIKDDLGFDVDTVANTASFSGYVLLAMPKAGDVIINEVMFDPPLADAGDINKDTKRDSAEDDFIELVNKTTDTLDMTGCYVEDIRTSDSLKRTLFTFPAGFRLPPKGVVVLFGGGMATDTNVGTNKPHPNFNGAYVYKFAVTGGIATAARTIYAKDSKDVTIDQFAYGTDPTDCPEGTNLRQSLNRKPDLGSGCFKHSGLSTAQPALLYSPGTDVNGKPF
jgi:hypothetical protein